MKVVQFGRYGGPEVLELVERPMPVPAAGEIVVRTEAIGVGVPDMLMRMGNYNWIPPLPVVPGNELAGTVAATGAGVRGLREGDRVYINSRELPQRGGCYAEAVAVPAAAAFAVPDGVDLAQVVTLGNYQLAHLLLTYASAPRKGDAILVHAAAGGAGSALVQMARAMGITVYGVAGNAEKAAYVRALGADAAIDRSREDIADRIAGLTGGRGVDAIYDAVGGDAFTKNFDMLAPMGLLVIFGHIAGWPDPEFLTPMRKHFGHSLGVRLFSIHVVDDRPDIRRAAMDAALGALAAGRIAPRIHARMKLAEAARAHEMLHTGAVTGKIVLVP
ncbi:MAG: zinc-binding alcohol dehydrogenase family protein [Alphaproteobacteria bacterium]